MSAAPVPANVCKFCREPVGAAGRMFHAGGRPLFSACERCAPLVIAGTTAMAEAARRHALPAAKKMIREVLKKNPVLAAALRGYEQARNPR